MKESNCVRGIGKWRPGVGLALAGLLAFSANVYGGPQEDFVISLVPVEAHEKPGDIKSPSVKLGSSGALNRVRKSSMSPSASSRMRVLPTRVSADT